MANIIRLPDTNPRKIPAYYENTKIKASTLLIIIIIIILTIFVSTTWSYDTKNDKNVIGEKNKNKNNNDGDKRVVTIFTGRNYLNDDNDDDDNYEEEEDDDDSFEIVETGIDTSVVDSKNGDKKKVKSRKTQTLGEQTNPAKKKRFRIRPAVPSSCTLCDKVYKNGEILRQHMKSHHVTGTIECPSCKLTFTSLRSLKYHEQRKHGNLEPVPCSFCGKKFLDKKYLRIHENIHSQTNHFVCQFCGRKFIMKTNLTVHISRHHTKKSNDFVCQICGKAFPFKLYLKKHFKTHTDDKPYECNHCEAKFRENTLLRKHVNSIHLKLRPFLCQYCHKTFTRSLYLREHMESQHLGIQRKLECTKCGETFSNRNRLRQHECLGSGKTD